MKSWLWLFLFSLAINVSAQKYVSDSGVITFFSEATIEDIKADNKMSRSIIDLQTSDIAFSVPIQEFLFSKKLMQQHFNEKYMESEKFPKATFSGKVDGFANVVGVHQVVAKGKLMIHGVTKDVSIPGTIEITEQGMSLKSKFIVRLEEYDVKIPQFMWQNIAEQVEVTVGFTYKPQ